MPDNTRTDAETTLATDPAKLSKEQFDTLLDRHPILERDYTLPTPMIKTTYEVVRNRVWARRTGVVFHAPPRTGKTKCVMAIKDFIEAEFPRTYVVLLSVRGATRPSDGHMYRLILEAENHALSGRSNPDFLFGNAKADILLKSSLKGGSQFVLLIDEMQLLNDSDLQQLVCFHNALELAKVKMTTISFAQPEILHRRTALMTTNDKQIIARFLSEPLPFKGCMSIEELRAMLVAYDQRSEYPEGSGWSYTRFFFPIGFANGFRLVAHAQHIWNALVDAAAMETGGMLPMEHVCLTIEHLLLALHKDDCASLSISYEDAVIAVEAANLQTFSMLMGNSVNE